MIWVKKVSKALTGRGKSKEHLDNISKALQGRTLSKEHCKAISDSHIGIKHSEKTKKKLSEIRKGMKKTKSHLDNMSKALKGRNFKNERIKVTYHKDNKEQLFLNNKEASLTLGLTPSHISSIINGHRPQRKDFFLKRITLTS